MGCIFKAEPELRRAATVQVRRVGRIAAGLVALAVSASCAAYVAPITQSSLITENGVRFSATSGVNHNCGTPTIVGPLSYEMKNIIVEQGGRTRRDPVFDFGKMGFDEATVGEAEVVLMMFDDEFRGACSQWVGVSEEQKGAFLAYHNEALAGLIETATRLEQQTTREGFLREVELGSVRWHQMVQHKPKGANWYSPV